MSQRRKPGDRVLVRAGAGFCAQGPTLAEIQDQGGMDWCPSGCGDPDCYEWSTLWAIDPDGQPTGVMLCHVNECEMEDVP